MTPLESDLKRDALEKAERQAARYMRSTFEDILEAIEEAHAEYRALVDPTSTGYYCETLYAAKMRILEVLKRAM